MFKRLVFLINLALLTQFVFAQCTEFFDYSSSAGWVHEGTGISVSGGKVKFNNAADGEIRRIYRPGLFNPPCDRFVAEFDFEATGTGFGSNGNRFVGHALFALTAGNQEIFSDCSCAPSCPAGCSPAGSSGPHSNQDAMVVMFSTTNPPDGNLPLRIHAKQGTTESRSTDIMISLNTHYWVRFTRNPLNASKLEVFSDSARTVHIPGSPVTFAVPATMGGFTTIQHSNAARGDANRRLSAELDNLCVTCIGDSVAIGMMENEWSNWRLYPNPVTDASDLVLFADIEEEIHLSLFDMMGHQIFEGNFQTRIGENLLLRGRGGNIQLSPGIYTLILTSRKGRMTEKVMFLE